jgi:hypothetical protein
MIRRDKYCIQATPPPNKKPRGKPHTIMIKLKNKRKFCGNILKKSKSSGSVKSMGIIPRTPARKIKNTDRNTAKETPKAIEIEITIMLLNEFTID